MAQKGSNTAFDPLAGTISAASLLDDAAKIDAAREELAREAEARRRFVDEEEKRKTDDQDRRKADDAERDEERRRLEDLVAQQTKVLEEKLTQLAATMTPKAPPGVDPEATQVHHPGMATGDNILPGTSQMNISLVPPRKSRLPLIIGLLVVVLIVGGVGGWLVLKSKTTTGPGKTNPPEGPEVTIKPELVDIPAGTFQMGRNDSLPTEGPAHQVTVNGFSMDKHEVTNAEYARFVSEANHAPPEQWGSIKPPVGEEKLPVSNVSYQDAIDFAEWRSKRDGVTYRLPTEEEWEYAARNGEKDNLYPWGNTWEAGRAAIQEARVGAAQAVGTYPQGMNSWGILDLVGNVWEWTSSKASVYGGDKDNRLAQQKDWIVIRGGCYASSIKGSFPPGPVSSTMRNWVPPNSKNALLGFRLVKNGS